MLSVVIISIVILFNEFNFIRQYYFIVLISILY